MFTGEQCKYRNPEVENRILSCPPKNNVWASPDIAGYRSYKAVNVVLLDVLCEDPYLPRDGSFLEDINRVLKYNLKR